MLKAVVRRRWNALVMWCVMRLAHGSRPVAFGEEYVGDRRKITAEGNAVTQHARPAAVASRHQRCARRGTDGVL